MKLIDTLLEKLEDMRYSPLYHMTSDKSALRIMNSDMLVGSIPYAEMMVKDKQLNTKRGPHQISFTRNKSWVPNPSSLGPGDSAPENLDVIFVVDKHRLKTKYRVTPFDYSGLASNPWDRNTKEYKDFFNDGEEPEDMLDYERSDEYEERVITDKIQPLRPYLIDIIYKGDNPEVQSIINQYMGLNEIETKKKRALGRGQEKITYRSKINPNLVLKIGPYETLVAEKEKSEKYPDIYVKIFKVKHYNGDEWYSGVAIMERLDTKKFLSNFRKLEDTLESLNIDKFFMWYATQFNYKDEFEKTYRESVELLEKHDTEMLDFMNKFIYCLRGVLGGDVHEWQFGIDKDGNIKCFDD